jgi:hypothetical protein
MSQKQQNKTAVNKANAVLVQLELVWWLITALVAAAILAPIVYKVPDYPFLWPNAALIVLTVTFARYIFQLRYTFLFRTFYMKAALVFACIIIAFLVVQEINLFQTRLDEDGIQSIVGHLPLQQQKPMMKYIHSQMILFGVGSAVGCVVFPLRLIRSVWRQWNGKPD